MPPSRDPNPSTWNGRHRRRAAQKHTGQITNAHALRPKDDLKKPIHLTVMYSFGHILEQILKHLQTTQPHANPQIFCNCFDVANNINILTLLSKITTSNSE